MNAPIINHIAIVGGDLAAWMCAAALSELLDQNQIKITMVGSDSGHLTPGEASMPMLADFHKRLGIEEQSFVQQTQSSARLGTEFVGWGTASPSFFHPAQALTNGQGTRTDTPLDTTGHGDRHVQGAYHIDVKRYADFLKRFALKRGVQCLDGRVNTIQRNRNTGDIKNVMLTNGQAVYASFFIDCTGTRSRLLGHTLRTPFLDWSNWLPCDRMITLSCEPLHPRKDYTQVQAMTAGWSLHLPLQQRSDLGYIYSSQHLSDEVAQQALSAWLDHSVINSPRCIKFRSGRRQQSWVNNCVALGAASGFLEPLESTNLHLIQSAILALVDNFPQPEDNQTRQKIFNQVVAAEYEQVRDFLILHYRLASDCKGEFWSHFKDMELPESLQAQLLEFQSSGKLPSPTSPFGIESWSAVTAGHELSETAPPQSQASRLLARRAH